MTYTFKLARRLAVSRHCGVLMALALLAACNAESTAPEVDPGSSPAASASLKISPRRVVVEINQAVRFRGHARSSRGDSVAVPIAWVATGGVMKTDGTFSSATSGTFKVVGRGRGWKQTDSSIVVVVPPPANLVRVAVTPAAVTLASGAKRSFTATGYLSDGSPTPVGVTWVATGGEVDPAGGYTAGPAAGSYRVIATNVTGTLADTAAVTVTAPEPPVLASVVVSPASFTLASGASQQFTAYGRSALGDSVAVSVAFSATGGTITPVGVYTAGQTAGSYRVVASASGLADTAVVTLTPASSPAPTPATTPVPTAGVGIPFGTFNLYGGGASGPSSWSTPLSVGTADLNMSTDYLAPDGVLARIASARQRHLTLLLYMTGGAHSQYKTDGVFDLAKWKAVMDGFNTPTIKSAVAAAVADGVIFGNSVMDEPHNTDLGFGDRENSWGPPGTLTKVEVDQMCSYVKGIFPTLPVGVTHSHLVFEPEKSYRVCDFIMDQYAWRKGDVTKFRDDALAMGRRDGIAIVFSLNILNGGLQDRDGTWDCPLTTTGGPGTYAPNCRMTPQQVRDWGLLLGSAGCALTMWRYDATFMSDPNNQRAFKDVAARLATLPAKSCRRQ